MRSHVGGVMVGNDRRGKSWNWMARVSPRQRCSLFRYRNPKNIKSMGYGTPTRYNVDGEQNRANDQD